MKSKPIHVTFEQAKLLKEKGFDELCQSGYNDCTYNYGEFLTPINNKNSQDICISAPEQHQVVEWLRINHGIWISVYTMDKWLSTGNDRTQIFDYSIKQMKLGLIDISKKPEEFNSPQEAYSAAFDYILKELI
jgi:hypothetical protein